ncbi:hypothetical protein [Planococcus sp. SSTMD024]|uniref:hypothetical protein n=1 Tax=Planococcus sp. SSTMD024 TaxID=3242163 RepID=UPI00351DE77A
MNFSESKLLLRDAEEKLKEIEILYNKVFDNEGSTNLLKMKIKQYLDNVFSALDYLAFSIFMEYSAKNVPSVAIEGHKSKVYFPITESNKEFSKYVKRAFPGLIEENPEIVEAIRKYQPFPGRSKWLKDLKVLANGNKHRNLTKHTQQRDTYIKEIKFANGAVIKNFYVSSPDDILPFSGGPIISIEGSTEKHIMFADLEKPVLKTLKRMYASAPTIIEDIEKAK